MDGFPWLTEVLYSTHQSIAKHEAAKVQLGAHRAFALPRTGLPPPHVFGTFYTTSPCSAPITGRQEEARGVPRGNRDCPQYLARRWTVVPALPTRNILVDIYPRTLEQHITACAGIIVRLSRTRRRLCDQLLYSPQQRGQRI